MCSHVGQRRRARGQRAVLRGLGQRASCHLQRVAGNPHGRRTGPRVHRVGRDGQSPQGHRGRGVGRALRCRWRHRVLDRQARSSADARPASSSVVVALMVFSILWPAASSALAFSKTMLRRDGVSAAALMRPAVAVPYTVLGGEALADHGEGRGRATRSWCWVPTTHPAGRFPLDLADRCPRQRGTPPRCSPSPRPCPAARRFQQSASADVLIPALREWWGKTDVWVVRDGDAVVGIVRLVDVLAALK